MILLKLAAKNFRQYKNLDHNFPQKGLIAIIGDNEAGKSTIQEMMGYALFGAPALRTNMDKVLSFDAKEDMCKVVMDFEVNNKKYRVERGFMGASRKAFGVLWQLDDIHNPIANSAEAATTEIKKIIGMDYKIFYHTYCVKQKELDLLSSMDPAERKRFVLRMLQIDSIDVVIKDIRKNVSELENKVNAATDDVSLEELEKSVETLSSEINDIIEVVESKNKKFVSSKTELREKRGVYDSLREQLSEFTRAKDKIRADFEHKKLEYNNKKETVKDVEFKIEEITKLQGEIQDISKMENTYDKLIKAKTLKQEMSGKIKRLTDLRVKRDKLESRNTELNDAENSLTKKLEDIGSKVSEEKIEQFKSKRKEITEKKSKIAGKINSLEDKMDSALNCIKMLDKSDGDVVRCPECGSELSDPEHFRVELKKYKEDVQQWKDKDNKAAQMLAELEEKLDVSKSALSKVETIKSKIKDIVTRKEELRAEIEEANSGIKELEELVDENTEQEIDETKIISLKKEIDFQKEIKVRVSGKDTLAERLQALIEEVTVLEKALEQLKVENTTLNSEHKDKNYNEKIEIVKEEIETCEQRLDVIEKELSTVRELKATKESDLKYFKADLHKLKERQKEVEGASVDLMRYNKLLTYFSEFKINLISQVTPRLSEMLSDFVLNSSNRYSVVSLDEDYNISVEMDGNLQPIEVLSGGAKDLVNACLRFSLSRYLNETSGSSMQMVFMDEIFASQDVERRKNLLLVMSTLKNVYKQIIVITHVSDIIEYVDEVIRVQRDPDLGSYLS